MTVQAKPNVIVILADDLGWADLSCYGSKFHETPNLDKLASEGLLFTDAYASSSKCSPTRAALLTGRSPARIGITEALQPVQPAFLPHELPIDEVTVAELLREAGYATWNVGKWHLGKKGFFPEDQGFDINIGGNQSGRPPSYFWPYGWDKPANPKGYHDVPIPGLNEGGGNGEFLTDRLTSEAIRIMEERNPNQPFFLLLSFYNPHTPIQAKPELIQKYKGKAKSMGLSHPKDVNMRPEGNPEHGSKSNQYPMEQVNPAYAGMIETMDDNVGRILTKLDELGIAKDTFVIFTSDNGGLSWPVATSNHPLRAGKGWLYEGGIRVPWIMRLPGSAKQGCEITAPVISADISPTILDICGLPPRHGLHLDGASIKPLLDGKRTSVHETLYWHYPHSGKSGPFTGGPCSAIRSASWKLIEWLENDSVELFNLSVDPSEWNDVSQQHPDVVNRLREQLHLWRRDSGAHMLGK